MTHAGELLHQHRTALEHTARGARYTASAGAGALRSWVLSGHVEDGYATELLSDFTKLGLTQEGSGHRRVQAVPAYLGSGTAPEAPSA